MIEAVKEDRAPVIISSNPLVVKAIGVDYLAAVGKTARVPLIHHIDHSTSFELCAQCQVFPWKWNWEGSRGRA
ncbi:MAG: hypothetical protein DRQ02_10955 [Candidatus Latescibacterota bacterium]|mgnify:CR=1 FL=1|nr:MAG: hypothetical protein DRQ02_10955 [Candidatus Latescibacterota bacterium]HDG98527.1 hypothetical protein [Desulfobacterales bacterium]